MRYFSLSAERKRTDYQTGAPVSKNADAIQKALTAIAADLDAEDDDDDEDGDVKPEDIEMVSLLQITI